MPKPNTCCSTCQTPIYRIPSQQQRSKTGRFFCSRSCAATFNNGGVPKRARSRECKLCGSPVRANRTYCPDCWKSKEKRRKTQRASVTLGEAKSAASYQAHARVRDLARRKFKRLGMRKSCWVCGYLKKVDICHLVPIADHPESALVDEINRASNLVALCPNHHWELDHDQMSTEDQNTFRQSCAEHHEAFL